MTERVSVAQMRLLSAFQHHHSIGAVARYLGLSQPTVSQNISALESRLGVPLVHRAPDGSRLTEQGRTVVSWAGRLLREADALDALLSELGPPALARLRVAASMTVAEYLVPHWLNRAARSSPALAPGNVELAVTNSEHVMEMVEQRKADIGFIEGLTVRRGLRDAEIGYDRLAVVVDEMHPWARLGRPMQIRALLEGPLVMRETGSGTREVFERALRVLGYEVPDSATTLGSTSSIKTAIRVGGAAGVISRLAVDDEIRSGSLVEVSVEQLDLRRPLRAVWVGQAGRDPRIKALVAAARSDPAQPRASKAHR